jgi:hypothetical protein
MNHMDHLFHMIIKTRSIFTEGESSQESDHLESLVSYKNNEIV